MSNMSYCRFENTYKDLQDCFEALDSLEISNENEKYYAKKLLKLCGEISDQYEIASINDDYEEKIDDLLNNMSPEEDEGDIEEED